MSMGETILSTGLLGGSEHLIVMWRTIKRN